MEEKNVENAKLVYLTPKSKCQLSPYSIDSVEISGFMGEYLKTKEDTILANIKF